VSAGAAPDDGRLVLRGGLVDRGGGAFERADVLVAGGRIAAVGQVQGGADAAVLDARRRVVVPGMVNAHTHSNENWQRGRFDNLPLETWLVLAYPLHDAPAQTPREIYVRTALGAMEMAQSGTTAVVDFLYELPALTEESLAAVVAAYRDVGLRALVCLAVADRSFYESAALDSALLEPEVCAALDARTPPDRDAWLASCRRMVERFHRPDEGIGIGLAPAGPHRCSEELLLACRALADELDLQVHTHTLETRLQVGGGGVVARLGEIGFLGPRTHLCHGVWTTPHDAAVIAEHGATLVHNPISNLKLGSGVAPVPALLRAGVDLSLGTDGVCSGDGQDLFQAVKLAALVHKRPELDPAEWIGAREAWAMATAGGARPGGDDGLGRIAPGARADLVLLDLDHPVFTPLNDPLLHVALGVPTAAVRDVLIGGRHVVRDGVLTTVDAPALRAEARDRVQEVRARSAGADRLAGALLPAVVAGRRQAIEAMLA
jgi:cytosine/adenosine deaminase-related metal-dependent hydrolase